MRGAGKNFAAAATAFENQLLTAQRRQNVAIAFKTRMLVQHRAIPLKAQAFQQQQQRIGGAGDNPWWIEVFNPQQPLTTAPASLQITGNSSHQGSEMERTGRAGSKTTDDRQLRVGYNHKCKLNYYG